MARKPTKSRALTQVSAPSLPEAYAIADTVIKPDQLFANNGHKPSGPGPWREEADKLAWQDPATGFHCIILRLRDGSLSGYVAVPVNHPLYGFNHDAIPSGIDVMAHGGLSYSEPCNERGPEEVRICHTAMVPTGQQAQPDQDWWFGFRCNHEQDFVPSSDRSFLRDEEGRTYRDEAFVFQECTHLAKQLAAIGTEQRVVNAGKGKNADEAATRLASTPHDSQKGA